MLHLVITHQISDALFALALVKGGLKKKGSKLLAPMPDKTIEVEITDPVFIDPSNKRLSA